MEWSSARLRRFPRNLHSRGQHYRTHADPVHQVPPDQRLKSNIFDADTAFRRFAKPSPILSKSIQVEPVTAAIRYTRLRPVSPGCSVVGHCDGGGADQVAKFTVLPRGRVREQPERRDGSSGLVTITRTGGVRRRRSGKTRMPAKISAGELRCRFILSCRPRLPTAIFRSAGWRSRPRSGGYSSCCSHTWPAWRSAGLPTSAASRRPSPRSPERWRPARDAAVPKDHGGVSPKLGKFSEQVRTGGRPERDSVSARRGAS